MFAQHLSPLSFENWTNRVRRLPEAIDSPVLKAPASVFVYRPAVAADGPCGPSVCVAAALVTQG